MIIGVDVDGVLADLHPEWLRRYNVEFDDGLVPEDITHWDFHDIVKPECGKRIYEYLTMPDLYDKVLPVPGAMNGVQTLRRAGHRPVFVTSCVKGMTDAKWDWLEHWNLLDSASDLVVAHDKSLINLPVLIDDALHNVNWARGDILFDAPWNRSERAYPRRVRGWSEVLSALL